MLKWLTRSKSSRCTNMEECAARVEETVRAVGPIRRKDIDEFIHDFPELADWFDPKSLVYDNGGQSSPVRRHNLRWLMRTGEYGMTFSEVAADAQRVLHLVQSRRPDAIREVLGKLLFDMPAKTPNNYLVVLKGDFFRESVGRDGQRLDVVKVYVDFVWAVVPNEEEQDAA